MERMEIVRRLVNISNHAVHVPGEAPLCLSIDDGIALDEAAELLMDTELEKTLRTLAAYNDNLQAQIGDLQAQINGIVKCGDCRHYSAPMPGESAGQCLIKAGYFPVTKDWFCADGERRDDDA